MIRLNPIPIEPVQSISIKQFLGANLNPDVSQIADGESPDMLNITLDKDGTPDKRLGYERCFTDALGEGKINGLIEYQDALIIAHGTKLYTWDFSTAPAEIHSGITDAPMRGFVFGGKLYLINGHEYLAYDGSTCAAVAPYVPTLTVSTAPTGGGTTLDDWNLIGRGFRQTFNGDGTIKTFQLALTGLDADPVVVKVDGVTKTLTTDYTVDRTTGIVTFITAPTNKVNNVDITAYKTVADKPGKILGCTRWNVFGGHSDSRVHLYGNPNEPDTVYRCGLNDPTYWPENAFNKFGSGSASVTGKVNQYDTSVVMKEDSLWLETFELTTDADGKPLASFPTQPLNSKVGCIAPDSVQLVDNNPVFLSDRGVYMLTSSQVRSERNVQLVSEKVNTDLLKRDLKNAVSIDHDDCYILAFPDGFVWVWDYRLNAWYPWAEIKATCFASIDGTLYFGGDNGLVYRFKKSDHQYPYNDDGAAISCYMSTKIFGFNAEAFYKMVKNVHVTMRTGVSVGATVSYRSDRNSEWTEWAQLAVLNTTLFSYTQLNYSTWTYISSVLPQAIAKKVGAKKIAYFQLKFENSVNNQSMGLLFLALHYFVKKEVK